MAWVNRTSRDAAHVGAGAATSSLAHLGPGCYESGSPTRRIKPNATPFGSGDTAERGAVTITKVLNTPGPGSYSANNQVPWESPTKSKASASAVFQSKSQRLNGAKRGKAFTTPGPGAYIKNESLGVKQKARHASMTTLVLADNSRRNPGIKWTRLPTAPSIPVAAQSFGYEQGAYGKLVRHEPEKVGHTGRGDDTLGPGEYEPLRGLNSVNKSRTTDFSKGKITRIFETEANAKANLPGPGQYIDPGAASHSKDALRSSAVFKSSITREKALLGKATNQEVPGPGAYHEPAKTFATDSKPEHLQFFGSTSTRFDSPQRESFEPGPASYYNPPSISRPYSGHKHKAPFSSKQERFAAAQTKDQFLAAPGSYEVQSSVAQVLHKVTSRVQTFGSTVKRFDSLSSSTNAAIPETSESQLEREMKDPSESSRANTILALRKKQQRKKSSVFASSSSRFKSLAKPDGPAPGDYEIQSTWNAAGAEGIFKSASERMKDKSKRALNVPGPGYYAPAIPLQKPTHMARPDAFYGAEPRFKETLPKVRVPGPGHYNTETVEADWNRPTYNITIATEMERAILTPEERAPVVAMGEVHDRPPAGEAPAVALRVGPPAKHPRSESVRSSSSLRTSSGRMASSPHPSAAMSSVGSASVTPAQAGTPDVQEGATLAAPAAAVVPADVRSPLAKGLLSDSKWEIEIAEFSHILDDMLTRVTCRELVKHTAEYLKKFPQHSVRFQIKMKQRALSEISRQFQSKLMLFYVLHEFLKSFQGEELRDIQREWFQTVDEILHACVRDMRNAEDGRKRLFKTLARWEELKLYTAKIKGWKSLVMGEVKPRRPPPRLPRNEAELLAEVPDQLMQFPPPPTNQAQLQINRSTYPYVFERSDFRTQYDQKQHWRYTAVAFIDVLAQCLGLSREIALTASMFFHRIFDRGIYAQERYKFAAACIFLAAKASSKRMKLVRMVRTMHDILETSLMVGDEEVLELERMQLLHYEIEVLKGIDFDLTMEMPFYYLRRTLDHMQEKFRQDISDDAHAVLEELFWLPTCLSISAQFLAEAAAYIACRNKSRIFSFKWCQEDPKGAILTERSAKEILKEYRMLSEWKQDQRKHFDMLVRTVDTRLRTDSTSLKEAFQCQQGGLRIDVFTIQLPSESTKKGVNESRSRITTNLVSESRSASSGARSGEDSRSSYSRSNVRRDKDDGVRIKQEIPAGRSQYRSRSRSANGRSTSSRNDNRSREIEKPRESENDRYRDELPPRKKTDEFRERDYDRERDNDRDRGYDRERDYDRGRDTDRVRDKDYDRERDYDRSRDKDYSRSKEYERSRDKDYSRDRNYDQDYDRSRDKDYSRSRDYDRDREYDQDYDRSREYDRDGSYVRDYKSGDSKSSRTYDREYKRDDDGDYARDRDYNRERDSDYDRDREYKRSSKAYDRDDDRYYRTESGYDRGRGREYRSYSTSPRPATSSSSKKRKRDSRDRNDSHSRSSSRSRSRDRYYSQSRSKAESSRPRSSSRSRDRGMDSRTEKRSNRYYPSSSSRDDGGYKIKQEDSGR